MLKRYYVTLNYHFNSSPFQICNLQILQNLSLEPVDTIAFFAPIINLYFISPYKKRVNKIRDRICKRLKSTDPKIGGVSSTLEYFHNDRAFT